VPGCIRRVERACAPVLACMSALVCGCEHVCMRVCVRWCACACGSACAYVYARAGIACARDRVSKSRDRVCVHGVCACVPVRPCACALVCACAPVCACVPVRV
jgi:hypothetical protein